MTLAADVKSLSLVHLRRAAQRASTAKAPLLLLLHGVGSNERSMWPLAQAIDASFEVLCVRSPVLLGPGAYGWFHVQFTAQGPVINAEEARDGWEQIARFIDEAVAAYDADARQVYVGGFSQGGIMSLATLLTSPARVAGAMCLSGRLLPEVLPYRAPDDALRGKRVLLVHGVHDSKLGISYAHWARQQLSATPVTLSYHELAIGHEVTPEVVALVQRWVIDVRRPERV